MRELEWIEHKGKRISYARYQGLSGSEMVQQIKYNTYSLIEHANDIPDSLLHITDVSGVNIDSDAVAQFKKSGLISTRFIKKNAVLGVLRMKEILLRSVNWSARSHSRAFDTLEEALDWLVEDDPDGSLSHLI